MTLDDRLALARDLIARRDAIDAELAALFAGQAPERRPRRKKTIAAAEGAERPSETGDLTDIVAPSSRP